MLGFEFWEIFVVILILVAIGLAIETYRFVGRQLKKDRDHLDKIIAERQDREKNNRN